MTQNIDPREEKRVVPEVPVEKTTETTTEKEETVTPVQPVEKTTETTTETTSER